MGPLGSKLARARSARYGPGTARLDIGQGLLDSTLARPPSARDRLDCVGLTWIGPSQNPSQNAIWIIQKCIQSISNPYPIKWIGFKIQIYGFGFEINPFKWIKTNMDMDNYGLNFVIWIFCPPLLYSVEMLLKFLCPSKARGRIMFVFNQLIERESDEILPTSSDDYPLQ